MLSEISNYFLFYIQNICFYFRIEMLINLHRDEAEEKDRVNYAPSRSPRPGLLNWRLLLIGQMSWAL